MPLEVLVNKFSHTRFEPMGYTTNKEIRIAKSVVDYIARWLGLTFLAAHPEYGKPGRSVGASDDAATKGPIVEQAVALVQGAVQAATARQENGAGETSHSNGHSHDGGSNSRSQLSGPTDQFARFQSDAPSCDNCGSITVRNGNCYLCHNCGNSMGCS